jgi:hypothetical protein
MARRQSQKSLDRERDAKMDLVRKKYESMTSEELDEALSKRPSKPLWETGNDAFWASKGELDAITDWYVGVIRGWEQEDLEIAEAKKQGYWENKVGVKRDEREYNRTERNRDEFFLALESLILAEGDPILAHKAEWWADKLGLRKLAVVRMFGFWWKVAEERGFTRQRCQSQITRRSYQAYGYHTTALDPSEEVNGVNVEPVRQRRDRDLMDALDQYGNGRYPRAVLAVGLWELVDHSLFGAPKAVLDRLLMMSEEIRDFSYDPSDKTFVIRRG